MPVFPPSTEKSHFSVTCSLSQGTLPVFFYWSKNGQAIPIESADIKILAVDKLLSTLKIENVSVKHAGNYTCTAKNALGEDSQSTSLIVRGLILYLMITVAIPNFSKFLSNSSTNLEC